MKMVHNTYGNVHVASILCHAVLHLLHSASPLHEHGPGSGWSYFPLAAVSTANMQCETSQVAAMHLGQNLQSLVSSLIPRLAPDSPSMFLSTSAIHTFWLWVLLHGFDSLIYPD